MPPPGAGAGVAASGAIGGQRVEATVDSERARYFLERGRPDRQPNRDWDREIERELAALAAGPLRERLRDLAARTTTDFATLAFVEHLYRNPRNRALQDDFERRKAEAAAAPRSAPAPAAARDVVLAFVPGWAWAQGRDTGADFARPRELLSAAGYAVELIETEDLGLVEHNAALVAEALLRLAADGRRIIVVSTSKGGAEAALALGGLVGRRTGERIAAWISIGGMLRGTPWADRYLSGPRSWFGRLLFLLRGLPSESIGDLSAARRREAFEALDFPPQLLTLQYVGAPLSGHLSGRVLQRYELLRAEGPNDGLTLLADELVPGGVALTAVGLDHYYRDPQIDAATVAMVALVLDALGPLGNGAG